MKKQKITAIILACILLIPAVFFSFKPAPPEKPNIIFLLTDDHRWNALGAMGNKIIQTPNLDKLAKSGLMFRNAYVTTAICSVSRASILSGQYESRHKINDFVTSFSPEALSNTYPMLLKKAGYQIGFIGKYGVGEPKEQPKDQFDFWAGSDKGQPDYEMTDKNGQFIHHTDKVSGDIREFLQEFGNKNKEPFCLSVSFKAPHEQDGDPPRFIVQERFKKMYANATIPVPETADPKYWNSFPDFFRTDDNIARKRWTPLFSSPELHQETVKNYYRLITGVDEVVGKIREQLKEQQIDDNTIIIFMGDNGFYLGEHGMEGKWFGHEESIRVPLLIYDPRSGNPTKGKTPDQIALNIDIAPTILNMAGISVPKQMQGINLMELVAGKKKQSDRKDFFYEHTFMGSPRLPKIEGVVSKELKYMKFIEHNYEELYDLKKDPQEKQNLATNPAYTNQLQKMRNRYQEFREGVK
ncbi:sulfatase [Rhodocytophaga rosea]|uniref:Sulfatase n=1 Tax=Rhodocytophaga rosea TaxID=2704465 RepID=A0A6C0GI15_9BACT|nr:sulfatase [Rhodocytophaga rosea]QHT67638.1 sulfatase [Rhodocytophaga rosea]